MHPLRAIGASILVGAAVFYWLYFSVFLEDLDTDDNLKCSFWLSLIPAAGAFLLAL